MVRPTAFRFPWHLHRERQSALLLQTLVPQKDSALCLHAKQWPTLVRLTHRLLVHRVLQVLDLRYSRCWEPWDHLPIHLTRHHLSESCYRCPLAPILPHQNSLDPDQCNSQIHRIALPRPTWWIQYCTVILEVDKEGSMERSYPLVANGAVGGRKFNI